MLHRRRSCKHVAGRWGCGTSWIKATTIASASLLFFKMQTVRLLLTRAPPRKRGRPQHQGHSHSGTIVKPVRLQYQCTLPPKEGLENSCKYFVLCTLHLDGNRDALNLHTPFPLKVAACFTRMLPARLKPDVPALHLHTRAGTVFLFRCCLPRTRFNEQCAHCDVRPGVQCTRGSNHLYNQHKYDTFSRTQRPKQWQRRVVSYRSPTSRHCF